MLVLNGIVVIGFILVFAGMIMFSMSISKGKGVEAIQKASRITSLGAALIGLYVLLLGALKAYIEHSVNAATILMIVLGAFGMYVALSGSKTKPKS